MFFQWIDKLILNCPIIWKFTLFWKWDPFKNCARCLGELEFDSGLTFHSQVSICSVDLLLLFQIVPFTCSVQPSTLNISVIRKTCEVLDLERSCSFLQSWVSVDWCVSECGTTLLMMAHNTSWWMVWVVSVNFEITYTVCMFKKVKQNSVEKPEFSISNFHVISFSTLIMSLRNCWINNWKIKYVNSENVYMGHFSDCRQ